VTIRAADRGLRRLSFTTLGLGSLGWGLGFPFAASVLLGALGTPPAAVPHDLRALIVVVAIGPFLSVLALGPIGNRGALPFLFDDVVPMAIVDRDGVSIRYGDGAEFRYPHEDIGSLEYRVPLRTLEPRYEFNDPRGQPLAPVPDGLVTGVDARFSDVALAGAMVRVRPDRYVLKGAFPPLVRLRGRSEPPSDRRATREPAKQLWLGLGIVLALIGGVLVLLTLSR
jgi:hypothetical protein